MNNLYNLKTAYQDPTIVFHKRMSQLLNYYGSSAITHVLEFGGQFTRPILPLGSYTMSLGMDLNVINLHLDNLALTVGQDVFEVGCLVFFDIVSERILSEKV